MELILLNYNAKLEKSFLRAMGTINLPFDLLPFSLAYSY